MGEGSLNQAYKIKAGILSKSARWKLEIPVVAQSERQKPQTEKGPW